MHSSATTVSRSSCSSLPPRRLCPSDGAAAIKFGGGRQEKKRGRKTRKLKGEELCAQAVFNLATMLVVDIRRPLLWLLRLLPLLGVSALRHSGIEAVRNFRPVSPSLPGIYRSASLEQATAADAAFLLDGAKIRTVIDLRNEDEIAKARKGATPAGRQLLAAFDDGALVGAGCVASVGGGRLRRVHVPLLSEIDGFFDEVAARLSPLKKAEALMYRTVDMKRYNRLLYDEVLFEFLTLTHFPHMSPPILPIYQRIFCFFSLR